MEKYLTPDHPDYDAYVIANDGYIFWRKDYPSWGDLARALREYNEGL